MLLYNDKFLFLFKFFIFILIKIFITFVCVQRRWEESLQGLILFYYVKSGDWTCRAVLGPDVFTRQAILPVHMIKFFKTYLFFIGKWKVCLVSYTHLYPSSHLLSENILWSSVRHWPRLPNNQQSTLSLMTVLFTSYCVLSFMNGAYLCLKLSSDLLRRVRWCGTHNWTWASASWGLSSRSDWWSIFT